ncbi:hypothetical protein BH11CYA1_BH11CYA1_44400 [soil metagenome]
MADLIRKQSHLAKFKSQKAWGYAILVLLTATLLTLATIRAAKTQQISSNRLSLGAQAKVQSGVSLTVNNPSEYDFHSRSEIENLRRNFAYQHPELLLYQYTPMPAIFSQIEDGKPWWGLEGQLFFDSGEKSIDGLSEESRFINNPFMLACANMVLDGYQYELSKFPSKDDFALSGLPLYCAASQIAIYPKESREEITYNVTNFMLTSAKIVDLPKQLGSAPFDVVAYNARDFGYNYLAVSTRYSRNINRTSDRPIEITQYIHCGGTCGYNGGCNNMSPYIEGLHGLSLKGLPAQACVYLWRTRPTSVDQTPDFLVQLNFI